MKDLTKLTTEEYNTLYNALQQRKAYAIESIEKYKNYNNTWHKEEYNRCCELQKMLEPFVYDESTLKFVEKNREKDEEEFKQQVLAGEFLSAI
jgi:hypothetical protein